MTLDDVRYMAHIHVNQAPQLAELVGELTGYGALATARVLLALVAVAEACGADDAGLLESMHHRSIVDREGCAVCNALAAFARLEK